MHIYSIEKLEVWKEANQLAVKTYKTTDLYSTEEKFGLISLIARYPVSISSNIVEKTIRFTNKYKSLFKTMTYGCALKQLNQDIIVKELKFISEENYKNIIIEVQSITNKINILPYYSLNN